MAEEFIERLRNRAAEIWEEHGLLRERVDVRARTLSTQEALGDPEGDDFPLQKGKERMMEARVAAARGQAFTDMFGDFSGSLADIAAMPLENNFRRAVFTSALNASLRALGLVDRTVHCRDEGPSRCAVKLLEHLRERHAGERVLQVGFQPKFVAALSQAFPYRVLDLDRDNIGKTLHGALVEGPEARQDALNWAELVLVTGSTAANGTLGDFLGRAPVVVYGVSGAAACALLGLERFCASAE
jgi:hypothetical protein